MEKLKPVAKENSTLSPDLDDQITKLLDLTKEAWKGKWRTTEFTELFPNIVFRLASLESRDTYTQQQKQRIFELGFTSLMELPWTAGGVPVGAKRVKVNKETQLWKKITSKKVEPDTESLIRIEIGCLILLGLSLENKEKAINLIRETYNSLKIGDKTSFRAYFTRNISTRGAFGHWVQENNLDTKNGFEWYSEVTGLYLNFMPQDKFPSEFQDLKNYPLPVIAKLTDYILVSLSEMTLSKSMLSGINVFQRDLAERLEREDLDDNSNVRTQLQQKLKRLKSLIRQ